MSYNLTLNEWKLSVSVFDAKQTGIEVCCHLDYDKTQEYLPTIQKSRRGEFNFSYRLVYYAGDTLARWQSRTYAGYYTDIDLITRAEEMLVDYVYTTMRQRIDAGKSHPNYELMRNIAESTIKHYHADFFCHDTLNLGLTMLNLSRIGDNFVWMVRDCGSWMIPLEDITNDWWKAVIMLEQREKQHKIYYCHNTAFYHVKSVNDLSRDIVYWNLERIN